MTLLSRDLLASLCPPPSTGIARKNWEAYVSALTSAEADKLFQDFSVTSKLRLAHVLAQWSHETGGLRIIWESGKYSAKRIMEIFGVGVHSAKITQAEAARLAGNEYALFERTYGVENPRKARELGNRERGDGFRYRGCSITQLTGRDAHERYAAKIGCPVSEIEKPINGIHGALLEWQEKGCNAPADADDVVTVTKKINGGRNGLSDRKNYLAKAKRLLTDDRLVIPAADPEKPRYEPPKPVLVEVGMESDQVLRLQQLLTRAGYPVTCDGKMGPKTEAALAGFEINNGLLPDGKVDSDTWAALDRAKPPAPVQVDDKMLRRGSRVVAMFARIKMICTWLIRTILGLTGAEASGLEVVENTMSAWDRAAAVWTKLDLPMGLSSPKTLGLVLVLIVVGGLWLVSKWATSGIAAKKDDVESGRALAPV